MNYISIKSLPQKCICMTTLGKFGVHNQEWYKERWSWSRTLGSLRNLNLSVQAETMLSKNQKVTVGEKKRAADTPILTPRGSPQRCRVSWTTMGRAQISSPPPPPAPPPPVYVHCHLSGAGAAPLRKRDFSDSKWSLRWGDGLGEKMVGLSSPPPTWALFLRLRDEEHCVHGHLGD